MPGRHAGSWLGFKLWTGAVPSSQRCREALRWPGQSNAPGHRPLTFQSRDARPWPRYLAGWPARSPCWRVNALSVVRIATVHDASPSTVLPGVAPQTSPALARRDAGRRAEPEPHAPINGNVAKSSDVHPRSFAPVFPVGCTGQAWFNDPAVSGNGRFVPDLF